MKQITKKVIPALLVCALLFSGTFALAATEEEVAAPDPAQSGPLPISLESRAVLLMDAGTGTVLLESGASDKRYAPGVTRLMSALLFMEDIESGHMTLEEKVTISPKAAKTGGTTAFLDDGGAYTVKQLLRSMGTVGANDACVALAERSAGAEEAFVQRMNERGEKLGLSTRFVDCTGMKAKEQPMSAMDLAKVARALVQQNSYFGFCSLYMDYLEHEGGRKTELVNPNRLVRFFSGCDGLGTGSSPEAGYAGVYTAKRGDLRLLCVVLEAANNNMRNNDAQKMLEYGFANYRATKLFDAGDVVKKNIPIMGGRAKFITGVVDQPFAMLLKKGEEKGIEQQVVIHENLSAPIEAGGAIGDIILTRQGQEIARIPVVSQQAVDAADYSYFLHSMFMTWLGR